MKITNVDYQNNTHTTTFTLVDGNTIQWEHSNHYDKKEMKADVKQMNEDLAEGVSIFWDKDEECVNWDGMPIFNG
jgi:hypothetical protein